jgi:glutamate-ammonia-ligase adenylyltransferase
MTVQSDLDLLFIYDAPDWVEETDGPEPAAVTAYYAKLGQRLIASLTTMTSKGALYEVDMRLRPFGDSGPIASSLNAFKRYYRDDAWTWELMALTRARVIAGDPDLAERVTAEIRSVLTRPRDRDVILGDVADMRERIARQHPTTVPWDCKHRRGGLIDIEFIAQAYQLVDAADKPGVLTTPTAGALARLGAEGSLPAATVAELQEALIFWQSLQGLMRVTQDRAGLAKPSAQLFEKVLMDLTGLDDTDARDARAAAAAAIATRHYETLIGVARPPS